jgi:hypothetical protein
MKIQDCELGVECFVAVIDDISLIEDFKRANQDKGYVEFKPVRTEFLPHHNVMQHYLECTRLLPEVLLENVIKLTHLLRPLQTEYSEIIESGDQAEIHIDISELREITNTLEHAYRYVLQKYKGQVLNPYRGVFYEGQRVELSDFKNQLRARNEGIDEHE